MQIVNETPFEAEHAVYLDKNGAERLVLSFKATYEIAEAGDLSPAEEQDPIRSADEYHGEPDSSSIEHEAEMEPPKPATDVFLRGSARPPTTGVTTLDVSLRVGPVSKMARVFGDRIWKKSFGMSSFTDPEPFEEIPLIYENAFGGEDTSPEKEKHHDGEIRNLVGRGFRAKHSKAEWVGTPLPNIEDPERLIHSVDNRVDPVGFGPICRHWMPRRRYTGTYDQKWIDERLPLLPEDFDERFHNAAPEGLTAPGYLEGVEPVEVVGCTRSGPLQFELPGLRPCLFVRICDRGEDLEMKLNTVTVDTDRMKLVLLWKADLDVHRELLKLKEMEFRLEGETP
jgi:hypothetical protein